MPAVVQTEESKVLTLRVTSVRPFMGQPRTDFDEARLADLAASLREFGQQVAVIVKRLPEPEGEVEYELIDGERRYRATLLAGLPTIRAEVRGAKDDDHQFVQSVVANFGREDHTPLESMQAVVRVFAMPEYADLPVMKRYERVGALFARSDKWVQNQLKLADLCDHVKEMLGERQIHAQVALFLANVKDEAEQVRLADEIFRRNLNPAQARLMIRASLEANGRGSDRDGRRKRRPNEPNAVGTMVFNHITRIGQTAELVLDMPHKALAASLKERPRVAQSLRTRLDDAIRTLTQLREAMGSSE